MTDYIIIRYNNNIYKIEKEPFETDENSYIRGWFIVKNYEKYSNYNELISLSIIYLNNKYNDMIYFI
jgi:hypothetical protein